MLHITASTRTLKEELRTAVPLCLKILDTLCEEIHEDTDLCKLLRPLVKEIHKNDYKVLSRDVESALQVLRKFLTGEIELQAAIETFDRGHKELKKLASDFGVL